MNKSYEKEFQNEIKSLGADTIRYLAALMVFTFAVVLIASFFFRDVSKIFGLIYRSVMIVLGLSVILASYKKKEFLKDNYYAIGLFFFFAVEFFISYFCAFNVHYVFLYVIGYIAIQYLFLIFLPIRTSYFVAAVSATNIVFVLLNSTIGEAHFGDSVVETSIILGLHTIISVFAQSMYFKYRESEFVKRKELLALNQTKDKFFSIIAHDLKNPISGFRDSVKLLDELYPELSDKERLELVSNLEKNSDGLLTLLENLLEWSRSQVGAIDFQPVPIELSMLAGNTIFPLEAQATAKKVEIANDIPEGIVVKADPNMLQTIIRNLISNAIKFVNPGGEVKLTARKNGEFAAVDVADDGIGMDERTMESLFDLRVNSSRPGSGGETGTGLGLILCKEFVERHGGSLEISSKIDEGSTFTFSIPLYREPNR